MYWCATINELYLYNYYVGIWLSIDVSAFHYKRKFSKCIFQASRTWCNAHIYCPTKHFLGTYFELTAYNLSC